MSKQLKCHTIWQYSCILRVVQFWCSFFSSSCQRFIFNLFDWFSCCERVKIVNTACGWVTGCRSIYMQRPCNVCWNVLKSSPILNAKKQCAPIEYSVNSFRLKGICFHGEDEHVLCAIYAKCNFECDRSWFGSICESMSNKRATTTTTTHFLRHVDYIRMDSVSSHSPVLRSVCLRKLRRSVRPYMQIYGIALKVIASIYACCDRVTASLPACHGLCVRMCVCVCACVEVSYFPILRKMGKVFKLC